MLDDLIREARDWIADCGWNAGSDIRTCLIVAHDYDGGWPEFVRADPAADEAAVYAEVERRFPTGVTMILYPQGDPTPSGDPKPILG